MRAKLILWIILLALVSGGAYWYYRWQPTLQAATEQAAGPAGGFAIPVEAEPVRVGSVIRSIEAVGTLRANESVVVRPEMSGRVKEIHFSEGQPVKRGEPLVTLETSIHKAELDQALARLELGRTSNERVMSLRERGLSTGQERDQALAAWRESQASVALARARLEKMIINAPFDGVMGLRQVSIGDYVSAGQDMVELLDLDSIKVDFRVPEVYLADVKMGQLIEVRVDALPDEAFTGGVYAISPQVDINGRSLVLRARIPNRDRRLKAGLFARVSLILERRENALLIPEQALVPQGERQWVYRVVDGKAVMTEVAIGQRQGKEVEITRGLAADARVVTAGQMKIRDGTPVQPVSQPSPQPQS